MNRVVQFPEQEAIALGWAIDIATGKPVYWIELVTAEGRDIIADYSTRLAQTHAALELEQEGYRVVAIMEDAL